MENITLEILLGVLAFVATTLLGIAIFLRNRFSATNRLFLVLSLLIDVYIVVNFLSLHPPTGTPASQLFWIRVVMFIASFIGPTLVLLVHTFPEERISMRFRYYVPLLLLMAASATASITPLVFTDIQYPAGRPVPVPGPGIPVFFADFVGLFVLSFAILIYKYRVAKGVEKIRHHLLLWGVLASFSMMGLTTVTFVVILKTSSFVFLGPIFPVILIACIGYAIVRHQMFDIKVVATQALIIVLTVILFARIFASTTLSQIVIETLIFALVTFFGFLLVRSVMREVRQREELERLTRALASANAQLQRLDQAKSEFISLASHQLRVPLTIIKGYLSLIREGTISLASAKGKEALQRIAVSNEQLIKLIENMLNLSRIESGKIRYDFAPHDLVALVNEVLTEFQQTANEKHIELIFHTKGRIPVLTFDTDKIREITTNLVHNAIKYSPKGRVTVSLEHKEDMLRLTVRDTGIGIKPHDLKNIFVKFARTDEARIIDPSGMGIGLYFVKRVAEDHGGRAWAESEGPKKGSTFVVELPIRQ